MLLGPLLQQLGNPRRLLVVEQLLTRLTLNPLLQDLHTHLVSPTQFDVLVNTSYDTTDSVLLFVHLTLSRSFFWFYDALSQNWINRLKCHLIQFTPASLPISVSHLSNLHDSLNPIQLVFRVVGEDVEGQVDVVLLVGVALLKQLGLAIHRANHPEVFLVIAVLLV